MHGLFTVYVSLASEAVGVTPRTSSFGAEAFAYSLWGMTLNNLGWLLVVLITTHKMSGIVDKLYTKYNPKWIKLLMGGTIIGLFAYLLSNQAGAKRCGGCMGADCSGFSLCCDYVAYNRRTC